MDFTKLRGHHIDIAYQTKQLEPDSLEIKVRNDFMNLLYGEAFTQRFTRFIDKIEDDTLIKVVSGSDDVCNKLSCPYSEYCGSKDYSSTFKIMIDRLPSNMPPEIIASLTTLTPEIGDRWSCRRYGLESGQTYRFGDIQIVEEFPPSKIS